MVVWFYGFTAGDPHLVRLQCALVPFDASSQKPLSPFSTLRCCVSILTLLFFSAGEIMQDFILYSEGQIAAQSFAVVKNDLTFVIFSA